MNSRHDNLTSTSIVTCRVSTDTGRYLQWSYTRCLLWVVARQRAAVTDDHRLVDFLSDIYEPVETNRRRCTLAEVNDQPAI